jgi:hypothetical protein
MKKASITFSLTLEVSFPDRYDVDAVANEFLKSDRFGMDRVSKDPHYASAFCASSRVEDIREIKE